MERRGRARERGVSEGWVGRRVRAWMWEIRWGGRGKVTVRRS